MRILNVVPKDITVKLELTATEIDQILEVLDNAKIDPEGNQKLMTACAFVTDTFFKELNSLYEGIKSGNM